MRYIDVSVFGTVVTLGNKNAGVKGESNATSLRLTFDDSWDNLGKRIVWRDSRGQSPTAVIISDNETIIPWEALKIEGWCSFIIEGYSNGTLALSATSLMYVKENDNDNLPEEPTASQAQQLQDEYKALEDSVSAQIEGFSDEIENIENEMKVWEAWDSSKQYKPQNKVSYKGNSYYCLVQNTGVDPEVDVGDGVTGQYWILIAKKGDPGVQGAQGIQGIQGIQGVNGIVTEEEGSYCFDVDNDGHLILYYTGTAPNFSIDGSGHLILTFDNSSTIDVGKVKGDKGDTGSTGATGNGISSIYKTGTAGNVDTYTILYTSGNTDTFTVTNANVVPATSPYSGLLTGLSFDLAKFNVVGTSVVAITFVLRNGSESAISSSSNSPLFTLDNSLRPGVNFALPCLVGSQSSRITIVHNTGAVYCSDPIPSNGALYATFVVAR